MYTGEWGPQFYVVLSWSECGGNSNCLLIGKRIQYGYISPCRLLRPLRKPIISDQCSVERGVVSGPSLDQFVLLRYRTMPYNNLNMTQTENPLRVAPWRYGHGIIHARDCVCRNDLASDHILTDHTWDPRSCVHSHRQACSGETLLVGLTSLM